MATQAERVAGHLSNHYRAQKKESDVGRVLARLPGGQNHGVEFVAIVACEVCGADTASGGGTAWLSLQGITNPEAYRAGAIALGAEFSNIDDIVYCEALGACTCLACHVDEAPDDDADATADADTRADAVVAAAAADLRATADAIDADTRDDAPDAVRSMRHARAERLRRAAAALAAL